MAWLLLSLLLWTTGAGAAGNLVYSGATNDTITQATNDADQAQPDTTELKNSLGNRLHWQNDGAGDIVLLYVKHLNSSAGDDIHLDQILADTQRQSFGNLIRGNITASAADSLWVVNEQNVGPYKLNGYLLMYGANDPDNEIVKIYRKASGPTYDTLGVLRAQFGTSLAAYTADQTIKPRAMALIPAAGKDTLQVVGRYIPSFPGSTYVTLRTMYYEGTALESVDVTLRAETQNAWPTVESSSVWFDSLRAAAGDTAFARIVIGNVGNQTLDITSIWTHPNLEARFGAVQDTLEIAAGATDTLTVWWAPGTVAGRHQGYVVLESNPWTHFYDTRGTFKIRLEGQAFDTTAAWSPKLALMASDTTVTVDWRNAGFSAPDSVTVHLGATPPASAQGALGGEVRDGVEASDQRYTISQLMPGARVFVHLKAWSSGSVAAHRYGAISTAGGFDNNLEQPLTGNTRMAFAASPRAVVVVKADRRIHSHTWDSLNTSDMDESIDEGVREVLFRDGPQWAAASWTVTSGDGSGGAYTVSSVERKATPAGPWYAWIHGDSGRVAGTNRPWGGQGRIWDVNEYLTLKLASSLADTATILRITNDHDNKVLRWPFSPLYAETMAIQHNQLGYSPRVANRYASISWWTGQDSTALSVLPANAKVYTEDADPTVAMTLSATLPIVDRIVSSDNDAITDWAGTTTKEVSLASLDSASGTIYRLSVPGMGVSGPIRVTDLAVARGQQLISRGVFLQRSGTLRDPAHTYFAPAPAGSSHVLIYKTSRVRPAQGNQRMFAKPAIYTGRVNEAVDAVETSIIVTDTVGTTVDDVLAVYDEAKWDEGPTEMWRVTARALNELTVTRGYCGSPATTHPTGASLWRYSKRDPNGYTFAPCPDSAIVMVKPHAWWDAMDFDINLAANRVVKVLMTAYELNPKAWTDSMDIPESRNGIPDILDEARAGAQFYLYLQDSGGAVRPAFESFTHPVNIQPWADTYSGGKRRFYGTYAPDTLGMTPRAAGIFYQYARLIRPFDVSDSDLFVTAADLARSAYQAAGVDSQWGGWYYPETQRLAYLRSVGNTAAATVAEESIRKGYNYLNSLGTKPGWFNRLGRTAKPGHWEEGQYLKLEAGKMDGLDFLGYFYQSAGSDTVYSQTVAHLKSLWTTAQNGMDGYPQRNLDYTDLGGIVQPLQNHLEVVDLLYLDRQLPATLSALEADDLRQALAYNWDTQLGANATGRTAYAGVGRFPPLWPLQNNTRWAITRLVPPQWGLSVYGPGNSSGDNVLSFRLHHPLTMDPKSTLNDWPGGQRYFDSAYAIYHNEFVVDVSVHSLLVTAALLPTDDPIKPLDSWRVAGAAHYAPLLITETTGGTTPPTTPTTPSGSYWDWFDWFIDWI